MRRSALFDAARGRTRQMHTTLVQRPSDCSSARSPSSKFVTIVSSLGDRPSKSVMEVSDMNQALRKPKAHQGTKDTATG